MILLRSINQFIEYLIKYYYYTRLAGDKFPNPNFKSSTTFCLVQNNHNCVVKSVDINSIERWNPDVVVDV